MSNNVLLLASKYLPSLNIPFISTVRFMSSFILDLQEQNIQSYNDLKILAFVLRMLPNDSYKFIRKLKIIQPSYDAKILQICGLLSGILGNLDVFEATVDVFVHFSECIRDDCEIYCYDDASYFIDNFNRSKNYRSITIGNLDKVKFMKNIRRITIDGIDENILEMEQFPHLERLSGKNLIIKCSKNRMISKLRYIDAWKLTIEINENEIELPIFPDMSFLAITGVSNSSYINFFNPKECIFDDFEYDGFSCHESVERLRCSSINNLKDRTTLANCFPNLEELRICDDDGDFVFPPKLKKLFIEGGFRKVIDSHSKEDFEQLDEIRVYVPSGQRFDTRFPKIQDVKVIRIDGYASFEIGKCKCEKLYIDDKCDIEVRYDCTTKII